MNVLIIQENGRHEKNRNFRECFSLKRAFEIHGHKALIWGLGHNNFQEEINFNYFDLIINLENYDNINWIPNLDRYQKPIKILWSIDAHCRGEFVFEKTFETGKYNYLLHSTKDFVKEKYHVWFPNAYDNTLIKHIETNKTKKFGFCGNYANRKEILDWLNQKYGLVLDIFIIGDEMVQTVNSYKCHFNLNIANDINYRSFETIGCGTLLLTNYNNQYEELGFADKKNCLFYNDKNELIEKINNIDFYYKIISKEAILRLSEKHSYKERVNIILNLV